MNKVEDQSDLKNFLLMNDGTKIHGGKISMLINTFTGSRIRIDDQKFRFSEVKGYQKDGFYYARRHKRYMKRIVRGSINVYIDDVTWVSHAAGDKNASMSNDTHHFTQKGDDGPMVIMAGRKDIQKAVADCPAALEMASRSYGQIRRELRKNPNYLNNIFDVYNNGCKPMSTKQIVLNQ